MSKGKKLLLVSLVLTFFLLAGCGNGQVPDTDNEEFKQEIAAQIASFKSSIEDYDLEGMLAFLDEDNFSLTITEEGESYQAVKDYATLKEELEEDEEKQLRWRQEPPEGEGYILTMELGDITFTGVTDKGGNAKVSFSIFEETEELKPEGPTDTGNIVVTVSKVEGAWLCQEMTIDFAIQDGIGLSSNPRRGFGYRPLFE